ncbi:hypothetical protein D3C76_1635800 [compost metagenome]
MQSAEGGGEAVVTIWPPTDAAQAFRIQTVEAGLQGLIAGEGIGFGPFGLQGIGQVAGGLVEGRLHGIVRRHGGQRRRCRLPIGLGSAPAGGAVALGGEQVVQVIQGQ